MVEITEEPDPSEPFTYPISYNNIELGTGWFDFNDSSVSPIHLKELVKQFGGSSESGYLLMYRSKSLKT